MEQNVVGNKEVVEAVPMKRQSKKFSLIESATNVAIGYGVAVSAQMAIFPLYDIEISINQNLEIGMLFTLISLVRSYVIRRIFNKI